MTLHVRRRSGPKPDGAALAQIVASGNANLNAWWFRPQASNGGCVIALHGIGDSRASSSGFAPMFLADGYSVLAPDSRAHGESGGDFVTYGLLEKYDVIAWTHWMQAQGCARIYGLGESLGASILIQAISVEPVFRAIVAECPYASLRRMGEYRIERMAHLPSYFAHPLAVALVETGTLYARYFDHLDFRNVSPTESMRVSVTPVLLIHGLDDVRTPPSESRLLMAARPAHTELWLVPGAGHTQAAAVAPVEFRKRVIEWFEEH